MAKAPVGSFAPGPRLTTISLIIAVSFGRCSCQPALFLFAVRAELPEIGPQIVDLGLVFDAGEYHLGARNLRSRIFDVLLEIGLVPDNAGFLIGVGIAIVGRGAGMTAVEAVELGADLVFCAFADRMAGEALLEHLLAGGRVLG